MASFLPTSSTACSAEIQAGKWEETQQCLLDWIRSKDKDCYSTLDCVQQSLDNIVNLVHDFFMEFDSLTK